MNEQQIKGIKADVLGMIQDRIEDIFIDCQNVMNVKYGDITPMLSVMLQEKEEALADMVTTILIYQKGEEKCYSDL